MTLTPRILRRARSPGPSSTSASPPLTAPSSSSGPLALLARLLPFGSPSVGTPNDGRRASEDLKAPHSPASASTFSTVSVLSSASTASSLSLPLDGPLKGEMEGGEGEEGEVARALEYAPCENAAYRWRSSASDAYEHQKEIEPSYLVLLSTYISYIILILIGHARDHFGKRFARHRYTHLLPRAGYAPLNSDFDSFYTRRLKTRIDDCFARPTTGVPGRTVTLLDRTSTDYHRTFTSTGTVTRALNISSYNYLGFAQARPGSCADAVEVAIQKYGVSPGGARANAASLDLHSTTEHLVSRFLGTQAALVVSMGFATNSTTLPALAGKGDLVISDQFNHASIRFGLRLSGASVVTFVHNDMHDLERVLRDSISQGQPRTHRPWKKIIVVVEGLYSMEGSLVNLPRIVDLKRQYKFYLYVDEAHSVGALGPHGRGVCDYFGVDPQDIDLLMGTFTKSFGAAGGYIAGSHQLIASLRTRTHAYCYAEAMSPPVLTQIIASLASIMGVTPPRHSSSLEVDSATGEVMPHRFPHLAPVPAAALPSWLHLPPALLDGSEGLSRLRRLAFNSRYLSSGLRKLGFIVYGHRDSPIVPLLLFNPGKMREFSVLMLRRALPIVVVVVGYPATPLTSSRVRFCVSASHNKADIDEILHACDDVGTMLQLKLAPGPHWPIERVVASAHELVHAE